MLSLVLRKSRRGGGGILVAHVLRNPPPAPNQRFGHVFCSMLPQIPGNSTTPQTRPKSKRSCVATRGEHPLRNASRPPPKTRPLTTARGRGSGRTSGSTLLGALGRPTRWCNRRRCPRFAIQSLRLRTRRAGRRPPNRTSQGGFTFRAH